MMKKYSMGFSRHQPKCRVVQDAIHEHFSKLKAEVVAVLEGMDKNLINKIGYPGLFSNQKKFTTFKRLKNREYKKLESREFQEFVS